MLTKNEQDAVGEIMKLEPHQREGALARIVGWRDLDATKRLTIINMITPAIRVDGAVDPLESLTAFDRKRVEQAARMSDAEIGERFSVGDRMRFGDAIDAMRRKVTTAAREQENAESTRLAEAAGLAKQLAALDAEIEDSTDPAARAKLAEAAFYVNLRLHRVRSESDQ